MSQREACSEGVLEMTPTVERRVAWRRLVTIGQIQCRRPWQAHRREATAEHEGSCWRQYLQALEISWSG